MSSAIEVRPKDWSDIIVLYDDGYYSVIWGRFRRRPFKNMGVRYNEGDNPGGIGYPSLGKYPLWYVEPPLMVEPILLGLQKQLHSECSSKNPPDPRHVEYLNNVEIALRQSRQQAAEIPAVLGGKAKPQEY